MYFQGLTGYRAGGSRSRDRIAFSAADALVGGQQLRCSWLVRWRARFFSLHYAFCRAAESGLVQHSAGLVAFVLREDV